MNRPPHPFDLMFGSFRSERFPAIRSELPGAVAVDAFLLSAPALELLRDLRPEDGLGEGIDGFVALVHAAYRYWQDGEQTIALDEVATRRLCAPGAIGIPEIGIGPVRYIQVAPRVIWAQLESDGPFEPLDGWFALTSATGLTMVACFGVHPERPGVSVVSVAGAFPGAVAREDGSPLFSPVMPGGDAAGLHAITAPEELLLLGWRALRDEETS